MIKILWVSTTIRPAISLLVLLCLFPMFNYAQTLQFSVTNGEEERCAVDSLIEITITPNPDKIVEELRIIWGDDTSPLILGETGPFVQDHHYPGPGSLLDCSYPSDCLDIGINGFCFDLRAFITYTDGTMENNTKTLTFKVPPRPDFMPNSGYICANQEFCLDNMTCPDNDSDMTYLWTFPGDSTSTEVSPCFNFPSEGTYPITLTASNDCGTVSITQNITVHPLPIANAVIDSGDYILQNDVYFVCLSEGGKVRLNGAPSTNTTTYNWSFSSTSGVILFDEVNQDTLCAQFSNEGTYTATLTVNSPCNEPSEYSIQIEVIPILSLSLQGQEDECLGFEYSPEPLREDVVYNLDGTDFAATDFPMSLAESSEPYILSATVDGICESIIRRDTFFVFGQFDPIIVQPMQDTTICRDTSLILLTADGLGGQWDVDSEDALVFQNEQIYFDAGQMNGTYTVTYRQGIGACEGVDSQTITIQSPVVEVEGPLEFCEQGSPVSLMASPDGGTWSGGSVDPMGNFTPTIADSFAVFYTYMDTVGMGCVVTVDSFITVVAYPEVNNVPDQFSLCAADVELSLPELTGIEFNPGNGASSWSGAGITNDSGQYNPGTVSEDRDTVYLAYTIGPGCTTEDTIIIIIDTIAIVDAGSDTTFCDIEDNPLLMASPENQGLWMGAEIDVQTGELNLGALVVGQTYEYIYTINQDIASCTSSDTILVTLADGQGVSVSPAELYLCDTADLVVLPSGIPVTGYWEGDPGISNDTLFLANLIPDTFQLFYVEPDLPAACNTAELTIFYSTQPTVAIVNDSTACIDVDCVEFSAQSTGAQAYSWDFGDGNSSDLQQACNTFETEGIFSISLAGYLLNPFNGERYCASPPTFTEIEILGALEEVDIIASNTSDCPDFEVNLSASVIDEHYSYYWIIEGIMESTGSSISNLLLPATDEDTTYSVMLTTTNGCNTQIDSLGLTAQAPLQADIGTPTDTLCSGEFLNLYNLSTGGNDAFSPQWSIPGILDYEGFEPPPVMVFTEDINTTLIMTLIDSNNCNVDTAFYYIEVQPTNVKARMNYNSLQICAGEELELINVSTPGVPINWMTSDGNNYSTDTIWHEFTEPGEAWVTIFAYGCGFDSMRYDFDILPPPELSLNFDPFVCAKAETIFTVGGNAIGHTLYYGTGDSTEQSVSNYSYEMPLEYQLLVVGKSLDDCVGSLDTTIQVGALPVALAVVSDSVCVGEPAHLLSLSTETESCIWQMADGGIRDQCIDSYIFENAGVQVNFLIATTSQGCTDTTTFPIFVNPTPVADFTYSGNDVCPPTEVQYLYTGSQQEPTSWSWAFGDMSNSTIPTPSHIYDPGGDYRVQLIVGINGICYDTIDQIIPVPENPDFDTLIVDERCQPDEAFVVEVQTDETNEITLMGEDYFQAGINRFEIVPPGLYQLEILASSGCDTTFTLDVPEVFPILVELMPDTAILLGEAIRITSRANATDLLVHWFPEDSLSDLTALEPIASPGETTTYILTVSDGKCMAVDTVTISVNEDVQVYFPNAFSPNDDGVNDKYTFFPRIGIKTVQDFKIFNRWGSMVYDIERAIPDLGNRMTPGGVVTWDGNFKGKPANPNLFVFIADLLLINGRIIQVTGEINLIR